MQAPRAVLLTVALVVVGFVATVAGSGDHRTGAAGHSITSPDTAGLVGSYTSLALDATGNPVVSYYDQTNADLKVLHCNDTNCSGGGESTTSPHTTGEVGYSTSLALDASGNPVVSYLNGTGYYNQFRELDVMHCNDANCAGGDESITSPDTGNSEGGLTSLALDASGNPVVSYYDGSNHDLKLMHCNDANCAGGDESIASADTVGDVGSDSSLALDGAGNPIISYYDQTNGDLKLMHCDDASCTGGGESITSPDTAGHVGAISSLALDGAGNPVVGYLDSTNQDLKLLHCNDANCAGADESITLPDTVGYVGHWVSLALDASGYPVVSYHDIAFSDLKLLHCNDANCAGGDESIASPDFAGAVGEYTSLALDSSGNPVVSYRDLSHADLKLLHCSDPDCTSNAPDEDGDGCPNAAEQQTALGSQTSGGIRDPLNSFDYFNPSHDGVNAVDDILLVVQAYYHDDNDGNPGLPPYAAGYNPATDRTLTGPNAWNLGAPNGQQRIDDVLNQVHQYSHNCG